MFDRAEPVTTDVSAWNVWQLPSINESATIACLSAADEADRSGEPASAEQVEVERKARVAANHVARCQAEYEDATQRGFEDGFNKGMSQGREKGIEDGLAEARVQSAAIFDEKVAALDLLAQSWANDLKSLGDEVGQNLIALSLRIAGSIVRKNYEATPQWVASLVDEILAQSEPSTPLTFYVSEKDNLLIESHLATHHTKRDWHLVSDPSIEPGGCKVVSPFGQIDATLSGRLERAGQTFGISSGENGVQL